MNKSDFLLELKKELPKSTGSQRTAWAEIIVKESIAIQELSLLLEEEQKIASRFLWLLTDIAMVDSNLLKRDLVFLFDKCSQINGLDIPPSFSNYWSICGIPEEREAEWIDCAFHWLRSAETNVTTKSRALFALTNVVEKYPDLQNELKIVIEEQLDLSTKDFKKRALKVLDRL